MAKKKKWNLYNFLNKNTDKPDAIESEDVKKLNFKGFFILFGRRFSTLVSVNLMFVICNFPAFFGLSIFVGAINDYSLSPQSLGFSNIYGALSARNADPLSAVFYAVSGSPVIENEFNKPLLVIFIVLTCLLFFTFGPVNCGCAHILRSAVRRQPVFFFKDFFSTIKKNLRQSLILGAFDLVFLAVLVFDISVFYLNYAYSFFYTFAFFFSIGVAFIYLFARMYMYMLCITFDLSVFKIIKNSVIFAFLGVKRNIMALLGQAAMLYIIYLLIASGILAALGVVLPIVVYFGIAMFMSYYASYKVIHRYMIEPYYDESGNPLQQDEDEAPEEESGEEVHNAD